MRRRELAILLGGGPSIWAMAAQAQQRAGPRAIGILTVLPLSPRFVRTLSVSFRELGYVEGRDIVLEGRSAEGRLDRLDDLAAELVRLEVAVIVAAIDPDIRAAKRATATIPIVM